MDRILMISLRHRKTWLVWIVGLALVFTGALSPAQVMACAGQPAAAHRAPSARGSSHCAEMKQDAPCCCGPGEKLTQAHHELAGAHLSTRCGCAVHAPDTQPAPATKSSGLIFAPELALLPAAPVAIAVPRTATWSYAAPATGPPSPVERATGPSRAPPAA